MEHNLSEIVLPTLRLYVVTETTDKLMLSTKILKVKNENFLARSAIFFITTLTSAKTPIKQNNGIKLVTYTDPTIFIFPKVDERVDRARLYFIRLVILPVFMDTDLHQRIDQIEHHFHYS